MNSNSEKIYTSLCILFVSLIMLGNLIYQKFVSLQLPFYKFELSVGAVLYPLTFLITDLITEFYGKERAQFCIRFAMVINILVAIIIAFMDYLPATEWSKINDETFHNVFGYYGVAFAGSIIACYTSQAIDVRLYLLIHSLTKGKYLWLRNNGSTSISLLIDTTVVIGFMTIFGIFPVEQMWTLIVNSYSWKLFFTICSTPLFYISVSFIKYFSNFNKVRASNSRQFTTPI
ncbi:queuosine precursor transporter [Candidatus Cyrtobacter comes]